MRLLAIDSCLGHCSAALFERESLVAARAEPMQRGQSERLPTLCAELLAAAGWGAASLEEILTTVGPGGFAGARIGPAFARGLALAVGGRARGVSTLAALAANVMSDAAGEVDAAGEKAAPLTVVLDARRGGLYLQSFANGRALDAAAEIAVAAAWRALPPGARLIGPGADLLRDAAPEAFQAERLGPDHIQPERLLCALRLDPDRACAPLYLRAPDAIPAPPLPL